MSVRVFIRGTADTAEIANSNLLEGRTGLCLHPLDTPVVCAPPAGQAAGSGDSTLGSMGKSDKNITPDNINKLRKRYDAFLEEDRRRKERNEDILAKLDKMRHTVTSSKAITHREPLNTFGIMPASYVRRYNDPFIKFEDHQNEVFLLNEISKKYILIPKLRPTIMDNTYSVRPVKQDHNDDTDWKSKYIILDKLKQSEKEEAVSYSAFEDRHVNDCKTFLAEPPKGQNDDAPTELMIKRMNLNKSAGDSASLLQTSLQENKAIFKNGSVNYENKTEIPQDTKVLRADLKFIESNIDTDVTGSGDTFDQPRRDKINTITKNFTPVAFPVADNHDPVKKVSYHNIAEQPDNSGDNDNKHETEGTEKLINEKDISHVEIIKQCDVNERVNEKLEFDVTEGENYPIDIINVQDFTPANGVTLEDGVNINPEARRHEQEHFVTNPQYIPDVTQEQPYVVASEKFTPGPIVTAEQDQAYIPPTYQYAPETGEAVRQSQIYDAPTHMYAAETREAEQNQQYDAPTHLYASEKVAEPDQAVATSHQNVSEPVTIVGQVEEVSYVENLHVVPGQEVTNEINQDQTQSYDQTMDEPVTDTIDFDQSEVNTINYDQSQIQAFENEQNEMFYSEQPQFQNYDEYNQQQVGGYNAESYDQPGYFQGDQQEGAYSLDVNEQEESTLRYDPNYEQQYQQYVTDQKGNSDAEPPLTQPELVEPTELIQVSQYEELEDITRQVEQELDNEAGYLQEQVHTVEETVQNSLDERNEKVLNPEDKE